MKPEVTVFIRQIREINGFNEFLEEIGIKALPSYKPVRRSDSDKLSPDTQQNNWVFDSGVLTENTRVLKLLKGE